MIASLPPPEVSEYPVTVSLVGLEWETGKVKCRRDMHVKMRNIHQEYNIFCGFQEMQEREKQVNNTMRKPLAKFRLWNTLQDTGPVLPTNLRLEKNQRWCGWYVIEEKRLKQHNNQMQCVDLVWILLQKKPIEKDTLKTPRDI